MTDQEAATEVHVENLISKEFLQSHVQQKVLSFSIKDGTKPGDNFMSVLYSISVKVEESPGKEATLHLLLKCYPSHPSRQKFLNKANLFWKELSFYNGIAQDLVHFQEGKVGLLPDTIIPLAIPPCHGGKALDFSKITDDDVKESYSPLDNYILMTDLRKSSSAFQMADSKVGLDVEHINLAFTELATMHALSWAYKTRGKVDLEERYPFVIEKTKPENRKMWLGILAEDTKTAIQAIDSALGSGNNLSKAVGKFSEEAEMLIQYENDQDESSELMLRGRLRKAEMKETEDLPIWRVICHGDCWVNNFLYQYDQADGKPRGVVLVDFPLVKLGCPTLDLSCLVYTSTRRAFRQAYLKPCLELYLNRFLEVCNVLKVEELPPQFNVEVLLKKFHVSKLVGLLLALFSLPLNLIETGDDLEKMDGSTTMADMFQRASSSGRRGELYKEWILELAQELYDEGVI